MASTFDKGEDSLLIPPFEDCHIHFTSEGRALSGASDLRAVMDAFLGRGITSVREMGHKTGIGVAAKKAAQGTALRIKASGFALYRQGAYGAFLGRGVEEKKEIPGLIREIAQTGADFLKVVNSGIVSPREEGMISPGGFSFDEMQLICDEARKRGLRVACHVNGDRAIRDAVRAGVSSVEHGFFVSHDTLMLMKERDVSWTPTVFALSTVRAFIPESERPVIEGIVRNHLSSINRAASLGIKLRVGTDSGSKGIPHGAAFLEEMRMMRRAGLTMEEILAAACLDRAEIARGSYLIIEKDFLATGGIRTIVLNGSPFISPEGR